MGVHGIKKVQLHDDLIEEIEALSGNFNIYDDFDRPDTALGDIGVSKSGHVWSPIVNFAGTPVAKTRILNNTWVNDTGEIGYLPFHMPFPLKSLGAVFSWSENLAGTAGNTVINFSISAEGYKSIQRLFHVNITVNGLTVELYTNSPFSTTPLLNVSLGLNYDTEYEMYYSINGTSGVITLDGKNYYFSHPEISDFTNAKDGFFEFYSDNVNNLDTGKFHRVWTSCDTNIPIGTDNDIQFSAKSLKTTDFDADNNVRGSFTAGSGQGLYVDKNAATDSLTVGLNGLGINTRNQTHSITHAKSSTGEAHYNTLDQNVNTEFFSKVWSGASNIFLLGLRFAGTGVSRAMRVGISATAGFAIDRYLEFGGSLGIFNFRSPNNGLTPFLNFENTLGSSSTLQNIIQVSPTISQSGVAGYRCLFIAPFESSLGSGVKNLIDVGTKTAANSSGTFTSKFSVANNGKVKSVSSISVGDDTDTASALNVGAFRYRVSGNNSYCEMCMQIGTSSYNWVLIKQNTW